MSFPLDMELDAHGEILFASLDTFDRLIRYAVAEGNKNLEQDLAENFAIDDQHAFRISHTPTNTTEDQESSTQK